MSDTQEHSEGGDPVCWLHRVCDECGAFRENMSAPACARCGTRFPTDDADDNGVQGRTAAAPGSHDAPR